MKTQRALFFSALTLTLFALHADVTAARDNPGPPPEIRAQLTDEQLAELDAATSMEAKRSLLDSWGIRPPERRGHRPLSAEDRAKMESVREKLKNATTEEEREQILEEAGLPPMMGRRHGNPPPPPPESRSEGVQ